MNNHTQIRNVRIEMGPVIPEEISKEWSALGKIIHKLKLSILKCSVLLFKGTTYDAKATSLGKVSCTAPLKSTCLFIIRTFYVFTWVRTSPSTRLLLPSTPCPMGTSLGLHYSTRISWVRLLARAFHEKWRHGTRALSSDCGVKSWKNLSHSRAKLFKKRQTSEKA